MYVTIYDINGARISGPVRVCEGEWLIPYESYNYSQSGNFAIYERQEQYPLFLNFNSSCEMRYYTAEEIQNMIKDDE